MGQYSQALDRLKPALEASQPELAARLQLLAGQIYRSQGHMTKATRLALDSLDSLRRIPSRPERALIAEVLSLLLEVSYEYGGAPLLARAVLPRLGWLVSNFAGDPVLYADLILVLGFLAPGLSRGLQLAGYRLMRKTPDPLERARAGQRLKVLWFRQPRSLLHTRALASYYPVFLHHGAPWELCMAQFQEGLYRQIQGNFQRLRELSQSMLQLTQLTRDESLKAVALYFETLASGARISWQRLHETQLDAQSPWILFLMAARAAYQFRAGRPDRAHEYFQSYIRVDPNPITRAQLYFWRATVARRRADSTPRRWRRLRQQLYQEAAREARKILALGDWGRLWSFGARRELALALVGLGQQEQARALLRQSIQQAQKAGACYEEALSRQSWAKLGWPDAEQEDALARQSFQTMGAWWELADSTPGLPLQELGQAARAYLERGDFDPRLIAWAGPAWVSQVEEARGRHRALQEQWQQTRQQLALQSQRWQTFLTRGPVRLAIHSAQGELLEGIQEVFARPLTVPLTQGESAILWLPLPRAQLQLCQKMLHRANHQLQIQAHGLLDRCHKLLKPSATQTPDPNPKPHPLLQQLLQECQQMVKWNLGGQPPSFSQAWFAQDLTVHQHGPIPWQRLHPMGRNALLSIVREWLVNVKKHSPCREVSILCTCGPDRLELCLSQTTAIPHPQNPHRFGLKSMAFRAHLAGGTLRRPESSYDLTLELPLGPPTPVA